MAESKVDRNKYIVLQGFMISDLKLKGNELIIYACIYGFTQAENQVFNGSLQYLADWTNSTKQGVIRCLKSLVEKGYIQKNEKMINGVKFCEYYTTNLNTVLNKVEYPIKQSLMGGIKQSLPNNIDIDNTENNISNNIYDENFENLWKLLKSTQYDRKSAVSKKRKKELYKMGYERVEKAIKVYQQTQNPAYYFKRDRFFNEIIDNYLDKEIIDFQVSSKNDGWCFSQTEEDDLDFIK